MTFQTINLLAYFHCSSIQSPISISSSSSSFYENTIQSLPYNWIILLQKLLILIYYGHHPPSTSIIARILLLLSQEPDKVFSKKICCSKSGKCKVVMKKLTNPIKKSKLDKGPFNEKFPNEEMLLEKLLAKVFSCGF
jgi:hypothetical protein